MDQLKLLKHEVTDMKNVYIEKQRESKSWDTKVQVLVEMKNEMKKKEGDSGDIVVLQKEIHRMRVKQKNNNIDWIIFTTLFNTLYPHQTIIFDNIFLIILSNKNNIDIVWVIHNKLRYTLYSYILYTSSNYGRGMAPGPEYCTILLL